MFLTNTSPSGSTSQLPFYLLWHIIPILHYKTILQIFSVTQMKFAFLVFLLTLLLVLTVSPLSCSTKQPLVFHFLFPLFSIPLFYRHLPFRLKKLQYCTYSQIENQFFIPSDYYPISLLSLTSKILDHHIFNYLYNFYSTYNILSNCQFGFQPRFSTETAQ